MQAAPLAPSLRSSKVRSRPRRSEPQANEVNQAGRVPVKKSDVLVPAGMEMAYDQFHFAPAVRSGGFLRCSGQLGTDERFAVVSAEPEAQFVQAFENVKRVLAAAKLDFGDVVEMTTFHVGLRQSMGE